MSDLARTVELLRAYVGFATVSPQSNLGLIHLLAEQLESIGARAEVFAAPCGTKANLFATLGPEGPEGAGGIMLSGHTDVVPVAGQNWSRDPFVLHDEGGALFGRGTCDMKGFIAAVMAMAPGFAKLPLRRPLHFAFTHDEEVGCVGAQGLIAALKTQGIRPALGIIGEPTEMRVIEGHKGCCEYTAQFSGLAGHGSDPSAGVNAAEYAARYVMHLLGLRAALRARAPQGSRFVPPQTTLNIGRIAGGQMHNVIAEQAEVDWEFRPVQRSDFDFVQREVAEFVSTQLLPQMRAVHPGADIQTLTLGEVPGLEVMAQNAARDLVAELTGERAPDVVPFGTEAGLFQQMGMDVVVCGPGSIAQAHKADEFIRLAQLQSCLEMLARLGQRLI
ncbi:MAG: acetylornithine deacetylase [Sulfitobacter sp.]